MQSANARDSMDEVPDLMSHSPQSPLVIVWEPQEERPASARDEVVLRSTAAGPTAEQPLSGYTEAEIAATNEATAAAVAVAASAATVEEDKHVEGNGEDLPPADAAGMQCDASGQSLRYVEDVETVVSKVGNRA